MILSQSTEYALRIAAFLALHMRRGPFRAREVAKEARIPVPYSSKILRKLVTAKILRGTRGHGGGFEIAGHPSGIRFIDIFEAMEGEIAEKRCVFGLSTCSSKSPCVLHHRWRELNETFQGWARKTTLADVLRDWDGVPSSVKTAIEPVYRADS